MIAGQVTDVESGIAVGVAVTAVDDSNGRWQFSTDGGSNWTNFGVTSDSAARLLLADALSSVRFVPNADWNGTLTNGLGLRAWDATSGAAGATADASLNGGSTAFGSATARASVTVTAVNDAPVLALPVAGQNATQDVAFSFTLPAGTFTDVDSGDTLSHAATLNSGAALPAWLSFNAATAVFSGTPSNADVGGLSLRVTATDGAGATVFVEFVLTVANVNDTPLLVSPIAAQRATEDAAFSLAIPAGTFIDRDAGATLSYSATLDSGAALPSWLGFNAATQVLSGTPGNEDVGALTVRVTATDAAGASALTEFSLGVDNVNDVPQLARPIADAFATEDTAFGLTLPAGSFFDIDAGDTLRYTATLSSGAALPAWLSFNAATQTFSGTPANADVGALTLRVTATDGANRAAVGDFGLTVLNANDRPVLTWPIVDQAGTQGLALNFSLPAGTFTDIDAGDTLRYSATLASGAPLPTWLRFDAVTHSFSGTPANADVGTMTLRVTATDSANASAWGDFSLAVANLNDAPVLAAPLAEQTALTETSMQFSLPAATFVDPDAGDSLRYQATLADGSVLPSWLQFDATRQLFTAAPLGSDLGSVVVRVTATDLSGATAQGWFVFTVAAPALPIEVSAPDRVPPPAAAEPAAPPVAVAAKVDPSPAAAIVPTPSVAAPVAEPLLATPTSAAASESPRRELEAQALVALRPSSRADALLVAADLPLYADLGTAPLTQLLRSEDLQRRLDEFRRQMTHSSTVRSSVLASSIAVTGGLSIGYVVWLVRGGVLLSSMLSALPAWQLIDPMPVLAAAGADRRRRSAAAHDDPDIERLFDERSPAPAAASLPVAGVAKEALTGLRGGAQKITEPVS